MAVVIKNVDEKIWREFKSEAVSHGLTTGEFLTSLVKEHRERESRNTWNEIFTRKPIITKSEAEEIKNSIKKFREGFEFR